MPSILDKNNNVTKSSGETSTSTSTTPTSATSSSSSDGTTLSGNEGTTGTYHPTPNTVSSDSFRRRMSQFVTPSNFVLKPGEYMHDLREGIDRTLASFANNLKDMNVYDIFLYHTHVITQDCKQPAPTFNKNEIFNRYRDIRCIEATRVKIAAPSDGNDYIHANYIDGFRESKKYILTQAPFHSTVEKFWEMIWQEKSTTIVSLTILDGEKVAIYLPIKSGEAFVFGRIKIVNMGTRHIRDSYDATILMVTKGDEPARKLLHFSFYSWPEKGGGSSGALIAIEIRLRKLDYSFQRVCGPCVDVRDTVLRLRTQREMTVQKPQQYLFIHLAVLEYAVRRRFFDSIENLDLTNFLIENN
uniref:protein-tyrosine-phosphatase n=1 Tax=Panagrolaimus davidi TaxID=227884 RepID=A0A914PXG9_9BILA